MANISLSKAKGVFSEIRAHWSEPAPCKYVPYREYKDIFIAVGSNYAGSKLLEYIYFGAGCFLMMYHYKLPYLTFAIIGLINMPLNYVWTLIGWYINDNLGFLEKKKERMLYGLYFALIVIGLTLIITPVSLLFDQNGAFVTFMNGLEGINCDSAFKILGARNIFWRKKLLPRFGRYKYSLYCDFLPKIVMVALIGWIPIWSIENVVERVWKANLLFAVFSIFGFGNSLEACAQNISPNTHERVLVRTYPIKLSHLAHSILAIILPVVIGMLPNKWEDINLFRWVLPVSFGMFALLTMAFAGRIKERIPQPPLEKRSRSTCGTACSA